jgi:hypothetical protein
MCLMQVGQAAADVQHRALMEPTAVLEEEAQLSVCQPAVAHPERRRVKRHSHGHSLSDRLSWRRIPADPETGRFRVSPTLPMNPTNQSRGIAAEIDGRRLHRAKAFAPRSGSAVAAQRRPRATAECCRRSSACTQRREEHARNHEAADSQRHAGFRPRSKHLARLTPSR